MYKNIHNVCTVLLIIVQTGDNTMVAQINKLWYIYTMEYYTAMRMNEHIHSCGTQHG